MAQLTPAAAAAAADPPTTTTITTTAPTPTPTSAAEAAVPPPSSQPPSVHLPPAYSAAHAPHVRDFQPQSRPQPEFSPPSALTSTTPSFFPASAAPSLRDPDTDSLLPAYVGPPSSLRGTRRYKNEAEYLEALRAWAAEKEFMEPLRDAKGVEVGLVGFYGRKTGADYASGERVRFGWRKKRRGDGAEAKGGVVADGEALAPVRSAGSDAGAEAEGSVDGETTAAAGRRGSSLGDWLRRRRTQPGDQGP